MVSLALKKAGSRAAAALSLAAALSACSVSDVPAVTSPADATPTASLAAPRQGAQLPIEVEINANGLVESRIQVVADSVIWAVDDRSEGQPGRGKIYDYSFATKQTRLLYAAPPRTAVQNVRASADWIAWYQFADRSAARDTQLFALSRRGGVPRLIDDARQHGSLLLLADFTLFASTVYWTVPEEVQGQWKGQLIRRELPDGAMERVLAPADGSLLAWPSVSAGGVAFEVMVQSGTPRSRVRFLDGTGRITEIPEAPASEPAVGEQFVAFKRAERFAVGEIAVYSLLDGLVRGFGPGEAPHADGRFVAWSGTTHTDDEIHLAEPVSGCTWIISENGRRFDAKQFDVGESSPSLGAGFVAWNYRDTRRPDFRWDTIRLARLPTRCSS